MKHPGSLFLLAAALLGCGTHIAYMPTNTPPRMLKPRGVDSVQVFTTRPPERPYVEVGIIETQQESIYSTDDATAVFSQLRDEAARQGCDGLVLLGSNDRMELQGTSSHFGGTTYSHTLKGYRGTCIVWKEDSPGATSTGAH